MTLVIHHRTLSKSSVCVCVCVCVCVYTYACSVPLTKRQPIYKFVSQALYLISTYMFLLSHKGNGNAGNGTENRNGKATSQLLQTQQDQCIVSFRSQASHSSPCFQFFLSHVLLAQPCSKVFATLSISLFAYYLAITRCGNGWGRGYCTQTLV